MNRLSQAVYINPIEQAILSQNILSNHCQRHCTDAIFFYQKYVGNKTCVPKED